MAEINTGDSVRISASFKNAAGVATDPTTITLIVASNDVSSTLVYGASAIVRSGAGEYYYDLLVPTTSKTIKVEYRWVGTGAVAAAEEGMFYATSRL